jgi:hypothetical protein
VARGDLGHGERGRVHGLMFEIYDKTGSAGGWLASLLVTEG